MASWAEGPSAEGVPGQRIRTTLEYPEQKERTFDAEGYLVVDERERRMEWGAEAGRDYSGWLTVANRGEGGSDDNMAAFLDFASDGDADLLIGSLDDPDRLLLNDGPGKLKLVNDTKPLLGDTRGTLGIALADLNSDRKLDVVQAQGENAWPEKVFLGKNIPVDTAPPVITQVEQISASEADRAIQIRARVHDNKSSTMPHDWRSIVLRWSTDGQTQQTPMHWYGEYLWRGTIDEPPAGDFSYQVCATDAAGNKACASP